MKKGVKGPVRNGAGSSGGYLAMCCDALRLDPCNVSRRALSVVGGMSFGRDLNWLWLAWCDW